MRRLNLILPGFVLLCTFILFACKEKTASPGDPKDPVAKEFLVTDSSVGELSIGMTVKDVESALGEKITLMNKNPQDVWIDSAMVKYKGEDFTLLFDRRWVVEDSFYLVLGGMKISSEKFKTKEGISVGSDKEEIWKVYNDGFVFNMYPEFEDTTYTTLSKTRSNITVGHGEGNILIFQLLNGKVKIMEVAQYYNDEE